MKIHRFKDIAERKLGAQKVEQIKQEVGREILEMDLKAVRELLGKTQAEVAAIADISQAELSRAEKREDHLLSKLRRYVEALGGELEVVARFGDKTIRLRGV
jgi:DNA-binding XRE family transcriptional regulator